MNQEAIVFGRYLLSGQNPDDKAMQLYSNAHNYRDLTVPVTQKKLFDFVLRNPWALGAIDGALAFRNPNHIIRKKILVMSAVLECRPQYANLFLPEKRNPFYFIIFCWIGFRAVMKALFGTVLIAVAG